MRTRCQLQNEKEKVDDVQVNPQGSKNLLFRVHVILVPSYHELHIHHQVVEEKQELSSLTLAPLEGSTARLQNEKEKVDDVQVNPQGSKNLLFRVHVILVPSYHELHIHHQVVEEKQELSSLTLAPLEGSTARSKQEIHRRSARLRNTKYKSAPAAEKKVSTKGKGRRHIFKLKNPIKAPESVSTIITAESIFYKGVYYQIGDVVSVIDEQDGKPYYAQVRGFIQDQYCEKSAALTWLIPTLSSPKDQFDPSSYIIGPEEDLPRKMEYLEFVCHAPSEYFKSRSSPFPTVPTRPEKGYIWTHVGPTPAITIKETVANHL
ncbi:GATA zinc finger domain-containing protein 1 [Heterocephalus glaber]|uniref:GATA zinc finger domain-containing protein 1 n=1 Tax=Heterocephalus glaber TaxID=10181 RepID=G5C9J9_HETGA|nr:GATA zinc finger domain-containing protein 1 [Heterocephalus glaber]